MINRRKFLYTLGVLPFASIFFKQSNLNIQVFKDEFGNDKLKVSKGPYTVISHTANDCRDCCGVCATVEVMRIIQNELELSPENNLLVLKNWHNFQDKERKQWINSLKRCNISPEECSKIYKVLKELRGPHNCFLES